MLSKRIIVCLDVDKGRVVKGVKFLKLKDTGDPVELAKAYDKQGADELVFLDITASFEKRNILLQAVKRTAQTVFMPLTVGGGVRNLNDIRALLNAGADKVSINTAAVKNPGLIRQGAEKFGSQCIVVAIDAKSATKIGGWEVYIHGGRTATGFDAVKWARKAEKLGAGEILLTSMDYDGTKDGFDIGLTNTINNAVNIPVIASGGAGNKRHFFEVFRKTNCSAALAASIFHYGELKVKDIKNYLNKNNIRVRL